MRARSCRRYRGGGGKEQLRTGQRLIEGPGRLAKAGLTSWEARTPGTRQSVRSTHSPMIDTAHLPQEVKRKGESFSASQAALVVKNPLASAGDTRCTGLIPRSGRSPGGGHGNPLQYSCLENPMNRGTWQVNSIPMNRGTWQVNSIGCKETRLRRLSLHTRAISH